MSSTTDNVYDMIMNAAEFNPKTDISFADPKVNPKTSGKSVGIISSKNKNVLGLSYRHNLHYITAWNMFLDKKIYILIYISLSNIGLAYVNPITSY